ncbi:copper chaperone PCu(A)C [Devosia sediminis]|uniref:Copper chaperone PCu(A)C n=1 Tax=Devosia sediminis TaxID=2798801 RepID=A0A934IX98_9HYPH|nr:copper chaperone PCu(A)C [Devosia sediminis]MBJ3784705.1 copper chaperone PCu(A)C [Devosia sediminis]
MMARLLLTLLALWLHASPAVAHSGLVSSAPPDNALLDRPPAELVLDFTEAVTPLVVMLHQTDGTILDLTDRLEPGSSLVIDPAPPLAEGTHVLSWRVVSADGHPISGSQVFSVGRASAALPEIASADHAVLAAIWLARVLVLTTAFAVVGAALFRGLIASLPPAMVPILVVAAPIGLSSVALSVGLQGLDAAGLPLTAILSPRPWTIGFGTAYGAALVVTFMAILLGAVSLTHAGLLSRVLSVVATLALAVSFAIAGHAGTAEPQWLTRPAIVLHIVALVFWLGALLPLRGHLAARSREATLALSRFSAFAPFAMAPLLLSAILLAVAQLGPPGRHYLSAYGAILGGKLVLIGLLLALAVVNRFRLTGPILAQGPVSGMVRSIRAEVVLAVLILALVAAWRFTPPPRVLSVLYPEPALARLTGGGWQADVAIDPGVPGLALVDLLISGGNGGQEPRDITLSLSQPELGIEPFSRPARQVAPGHWRVEGLNLPTHGQWDLALDIRATRLHRVTLEGQIELRSRSGETSRQPIVVASLGDLQIADAFSRATLPGASVAGAYFTILNTGTKPDRLLGATTPKAARITAHGMQVDNQIMRMRQTADGIDIPAGATTRLEPGGLHLMMEDLVEPVVEGETVPITLTFETSGTVTVNLEVLGFAADGFASHEQHP